jgi:RND superfamily putative drug exporter
VWALLIALASGLLMGLAGSDESASQSPVALPASAESARAAAMLTKFPGGDQAPAILVVTRSDGAPLTPSDTDAAQLARERVAQAAGSTSGPLAAVPLSVSTDKKAALAAVPLSTKLSGFALNDALPAGLSAQLTGGPAFGADIANAFAGANVTLLAVTAAVVALLLILTYRSPVLFLVPLAVIGFADRVGAVVGGLVTSAAGLTADGSTAGITSAWSSVRAPTTRCC